MKNGEQSIGLLESDGGKTNRTRRPILNERIGRQIGRFAERLKEAIGDEPVRSFGRRAGISEGALRQYLKGNRFPDLDLLAAIADTANVNLLWLATGEGPMRGESVVASIPCAGHVDMEALIKALALVESFRVGAPVEQKAKAVATAYALLANEGRPLDADAIRQVVESLVK
jgi:transcriptional regulator with XRE-family HTH domain